MTEIGMCTGQLIEGMGSRCRNRQTDKELVGWGETLEAGQANEADAGQV